MFEAPSPVCMHGPGEGGLIWSTLWYPRLASSVVKIDDNFYLVGRSKLYNIRYIQNILTV